MSSSSNAASKTAWASPSADAGRRVSETNTSTKHGGSKSKRRVISVRRSKTLEPELNRFQQYQRDPDSSSRLTQQFDVTKKQQKLTPMGVKSHTSAADATDLNLMVRGTGTGGQVSSVCSQVEAPRTVDQLNLKLGGVGNSGLGANGANSAISPASIKQRLGSYREYLWKQCLNCATRIGQWRPGGQKKGRRKSQCSTGEIGDEPAQQYWGPLIGHGDNGPSAKPLFSTFRAEGHVTSTCLWHACRAVTIGALLIVMGMAMSILGFVGDQREYNDRMNNKTHPPVLKSGPGMIEPVERFRLNNLSFAGPVIMGVGGFLITVACIMTFEARDNAAKVVPATSGNNNEDERKASLKKESAAEIALNAFTTSVSRPRQQRSSFAQSKNLLSTISSGTNQGVCTVGTVNIVSGKDP